MKLSKYKSKRNLHSSPEPKGRVRKIRGKPLVFVIQKHHASRLHYDLRLEADGVLKSWAVPKKPTMDPRVKRLAILVEDHPYSYKDFQGVIPEGYGAGSVEIWDQGTYSVQGENSRVSEKLVLEGIKKGVVHFTLQGEQLKGEFLLIRLKTSKKNEWLFFKKREAETAGKISHQDKLYFPKEGISKGDLAIYYETISPWILPHLKNRPISCKRFPEGIEKSGFFQKNWSKVPKGIKTSLVKGVRYLLIQDQKSLLYAVQLGCIEIHPFLSRGKNPDYLVFDLDPKGASFDKVVKIAQSLHKALKKAGAQSFCKTSGASGLHIFVPLGACCSYIRAKAFAKKIAEIVCKKLPEISTLERSLSKRKGKVYIDFLQNDYGKTVVAPYSVRATEGASVSTPLRWSEVKKGLNPQKFTVKTVPNRVKKLGDLFAPILEKEAVDFLK